MFGVGPRGGVTGLSRATPIATVLRLVLIQLMFVPLEVLMAISVTLQGAYGRKYSSGAAMLADLIDGKDFVGTNPLGS